MTCEHSASYIKGKETATNMEIRCALCDLKAAIALLEDTKSRFGCDINWVYRRDAFLASTSDAGAEPVANLSGGCYSPPTDNTGD